MRVVIAALIGLVVAGLAVFILHDGGKIVFWVFGLLLTVFVGPAQAASGPCSPASTPVGKETEIFGLWATTGRAASFLSPAFWSILIGIFAAQYWGILGIVFVIAVGLVLHAVREDAPAGAAQGEAAGRSRVAVGCV